MSDCASIDVLVTSYVDDDLPAGERAAVERHLVACPPCHSRVAAERAVQQMLAAQKCGLQTGCAPDALRARCQALARSAAPPAARGAWSQRIAPLALAATLVVIVSGAFVYQLTVHSSRLMAAELTADHMKCFAMNGLLGTHQTEGTVESALASGFGWNAQLPADDEREGLALVGARPCFYAEGRIAHVMYRHNGHPVSLFMLPRGQRPDEVVNVLGHEATIWSVGERTFVLVGREEKDDFQRLASFVRASLH